MEQGRSECSREASKLETVHRFIGSSHYRPLSGRSWGAERNGPPKPATPSSSASDRGSADARSPTDESSIRSPGRHAHEITCVVSAPKILYEDIEYAGA